MRDNFRTNFRNEKGRIIANSKMLARPNVTCVLDRTQAAPKEGCYYNLEVVKEMDHPYRRKEKIWFVKYVNKEVDERRFKITLQDVVKNAEVSYCFHKIWDDIKKWETNNKEEVISVLEALEAQKEVLRDQYIIQLVKDKLDGIIKKEEDTLKEQKRKEELDALNERSKKEYREREALRLEQKRIESLKEREKMVQEIRESGLTLQEFLEREIRNFKDEQDEILESDYTDWQMTLLERSAGWEHEKTRWQIESLFPRL